MSRKELYNKIKELGIADNIKKKFNRNYTLISNADLESFINGFNIKKVTVKTTPSKGTTNTAKDCSKAIIGLVSTLQAKKYLTADEADDVLKML